jgi:hypothetical protein
MQFTTNSYKINNYISEKMFRRLNAGSDDGLDFDDFAVDGLVVCGLFGSIGILLVNGMRPSNINCASPVKRRYQSEGKEKPSASNANQPSIGSGRSLAFAVTLKIAVPSSTSSN